MKYRTLGAVGVLALALTACGGGDDAQASESISQAIRDSESQDMALTQQQADCIGDGFVEEIGTDQLVEYGIITEDLKASGGIEDVEMSEGDAGSAADVMAECADIKALFTGAMSELPEEAQTCVDENLTDEVLHDFLVSIFMNDQQGGQQELMGALQECLTPGG